MWTPMTVPYGDAAASTAGTDEIVFPRTEPLRDRQ